MKKSAEKCRFLLNKGGESVKNKKRNYNVMKGNIIKKLYEDEDGSFFGLNQSSFKYK